MTRFRIGIWPSGRVELPAFEAPEILLEGDLLRFPEEFESDESLLGRRKNRSHLVKLPEEFYLRELRDLDLGDADAILEFARRWGYLGEPGLTEIPKFPYRPDIQKDERFRKHIRSLLAPHLDNFDVWHKRHFIHIEEFRAHAVLLRDLARVWDVLSRKGSPAELKGDWEGWLSSPADELRMHIFLAHFLNHGLKPFHVRIEVGIEGAEPAFGKPEVSLYSAMCLQLANHIAEGKSYRRCKNCGRLFVTQRGRAKQGQNRREGTIRYCSKTCAKAHAQRDLYQRQQEARRLAAEGQSAAEIAAALRARPDAVERWLAPTKKA